MTNFFEIMLHDNENLNLCLCNVQVNAGLEKLKFFLEKGFRFFRFSGFLGSNI